jgi:hypothetical protein
LSGFIFIVHKKNDRKSSDFRFIVIQTPLPTRILARESEVGLFSQYIEKHRKEGEKMSYESEYFLGESTVPMQHVSGHREFKMPRELLAQRTPITTRLAMKAQYLKDKYMLNTDGHNSLHHSEEYDVHIGI